MAENSQEALRPSWREALGWEQLLELPQALGYEGRR